MKVNRGRYGVEGVCFTSRVEVYLVTDAAMYSVQRRFVDGIFRKIGPGKLGSVLDWLDEKTPSTRGFRDLQAIGQQALLNANSSGEEQEVHLDLSWSPQLSEVAVGALRHYVPFIERLTHSGDDFIRRDASQRLELTEGILHQAAAATQQSPQ